MKLPDETQRAMLWNWTARGAAASAALLAAFACGGSQSAAGDPGADSGADGPGLDPSGDAQGSEGGPLTPSERCAAIQRSIEEAGFASEVKVECDSTYAKLTSNTYPSHIKMNGITGTNDQVPVPAPGYVTPVVLSPVRAAKVTSIDAALGVAVNGVPIYDYSSQGTNDVTVYDPKFDTKLTGELDVCNGHSGRGDDYHYHAAPTCMMAAMKNKGPSAIIGWAFDGYPIYGNQNPDGTAIAPGELDVCNAKNDPTFGARYHTTDAHPYIIQCLVGEFDLAKAPRVPPLAKQGGGGKPPGSKPPAGVANLNLVEDAEGLRTMTYDHGGTNYSFRYRPSSSPGCWDFEERSYTTGGNTVTATYCRAP